MKQEQEDNYKQGWEQGGRERNYMTLKKKKIQYFFPSKSFKLKKRNLTLSHNW